jgi:hypothetical protein
VIKWFLHLERVKVPFILYGITAYKAQLAISDCWSMLQEQDKYPSAKYGTFPILEKEKSKIYLVPQSWKKIYWGR